MSFDDNFSPQAAGRDHELKFGEKGESGKEDILL